MSVLPLNESQKKRLYRAYTFLFSLCHMFLVCFFSLFFFMRFVQKCVQDVSNSTRANTRTLPECASIKDKKL